MQMEISLPSNTTQGVVAALLLLCLGLGGLGYFVTPQEAGEASRRVEIVMKKPGLEAKTMPGYYP